MVYAALLSRYFSDSLGVAVEGSSQLLMLHSSQHAFESDAVPFAGRHASDKRTPTVCQLPLQHSAHDARTYVNATASLCLGQVLGPLRSIKQLL